MHIINATCQNSVSTSVICSKDGGEAFLTVESKENSKLLESSWSQLARGHRDRGFRQVFDDLLDSVRVLGEFSIVCLVSLLDLFCFGVS